MIDDLDLERLQATFENVTEIADANLLWEGEDHDHDHDHDHNADDGDGDGDDGDDGGIILMG